MRPDLPRGTVTFLFTDVEGSTRLLHELGTERYAEALADHRRLIREACGREGGVEVDTQGDAFFFAFPTAPGALAAAAAFTEALAAGPIRVRVGLHTGTPLLADEGYVGDDVHRAARIAAAGHGGQVLVSSSTASLLEHELRDLGEHRFKDLAAAERVHQLGNADFSPLKSLYRTNLPVPSTSFVGRVRDLADVAALLMHDEIRLVTLTGPGGTGKTRLALQAAAHAAESFPDGVWWIPLAPVRDPSLVLASAAQVLEIPDEEGALTADSLRKALAGKRALLLFDNVEHLLPEAAVEIASIRDGLVSILVTSRERLQVQGEHVYSVPPLEQRDGVELFLSRARALTTGFEANGAVGELCTRLENLPLAIELAAARTVVFTPEQLLARLGERLDLFQGGRDADPRQQTLRATIEWSYDLLEPDEQRLFRLFSVFVGGAAFESAEVVCEAEPNVLQSLLDKSLLRSRNTRLGRRYWMLETIREFAAERLEESPADRRDVRHAHAVVHAHLAAELADPLASDYAAASVQLVEELGNLRTALSYAAEHDEVAIFGDLLYGLWRFWLTVGHGNEAREWAERYVASGRDAVPPLERFSGDLSVSEIFRFTGDPKRALELKKETLVTSRANPEAELHGRRLVRWTAALLSDLAQMELAAGDLDAARDHASQALELRRRLGAPGGIAHALIAPAMIAYTEGHFAEASALFSESEAGWREEGRRSEALQSALSAAECDLLLGMTHGVDDRLRESADALREDPDRGWLVLLMRVAALHLELGEHPGRSAPIWGLADRLEHESGMTMFFPAEDEVQRRSRDRARAALGSAAFEDAYDKGARLPDDEAIDLVLGSLR